ncbi:hypothetical protein MesoLj113b_26430 [Mesorhizobium sp. 113-3-3]|nr:hypothetical protein MesoLj113b_26430 [Mesorhizobium sp. 113-3-3]
MWRKRPPARHARAWGNLAALHKAVRDARVEALSSFRREVADGSYPADAEIAGIADAELEALCEALEAGRD